MSGPIEQYVLTEHALESLERRGLDQAVVSDVVGHPQQWSHVRPGRVVLQSIIEMRGRRYLVRVFIDVDRSPAEVVTAYRTSKIDMYWRTEP
jgi:hypothetical protein